MNPANNLKELGSRFSTSWLQMGIWPTDTSTEALRPWAKDPFSHVFRNCNNKCVVFQAIKFVVICYIAIGNKSTKKTSCIHRKLLTSQSRGILTYLSNWKWQVYVPTDAVLKKYIGELVACWNRLLCILVTWPDNGDNYNLYYIWWL